ncbi:MAG: hypothetical protein B7O98_02360 [Zestosphaera tikiterensis]|uniref:6-hydroxymethyl-7,8-dihydropterin pyrophosphokinase n=1 Tax=Zestosphaera tikiterensis TaxID=1973259 RepID=A0A2R7Y6Y2_9CREN|nr:MAG: hypothetical protein B7O98_02360 [Zestosphaera tikiterensis]
MSASELRNSLLWCMIYKRITDELGFCDDRDYVAGKTLDVILQSFKPDPHTTLQELKNMFINRKVLVIGAGPSCVHTDLKSVSASYDVLVGADGGYRCALSKGVETHVIVTDLDGVTLNDLMNFNGFIVIHAHGDNILKLISWIPLLKGRKVLGTAQVCIPSSNLLVFGGFTDGDRAAYLALNLGAKSIDVIGFDFNEVVGRYSKPELKEDTFATKTKVKKLFWCRRLLDYMVWLRDAENRRVC